jgi:hypothetical protein
MHTTNQGVKLKSVSDTANGHAADWIQVAENTEQQQFFYENTGSTKIKLFGFFVSQHILQESEKWQEKSE